MKLLVKQEASGFWGGERIVSLSLLDRGGDGCVATIQSRFSGLIHSDGPDLLRRLQVEVLGSTADRDSKAFKRFRDCMEGPGVGSDRCEERYRKDLSASSKNSVPASNDKDWWETSKKQ